VGDFFHMLSDKKYYVWGLNRRGNIIKIDASFEEALKKALYQKELISKIDSLRVDYSGKFKAKNNITIYPTGDK